MTTPLPPGTRVRIEDSYGYAYPDPLERGAFLVVTITAAGVYIVEAGIKREQMVEAPMCSATLTDYEITAVCNRALRSIRAGEGSDSDLVSDCHLALPGSTHWVAIADWGETRPVDRRTRDDARARIVAHLLAQPAVRS